MNTRECKQWWDDYQAKFPSAGKWASTLTDVQWREVFAAWAEILAPASLADALEVNRKMRSGELPEVGSFDQDREKIGHAVRSDCDGLVRSRRPKPRPDWQVDRYRCGLCRDTGQVEVFRGEWLAWLASQDEIPQSMKAASNAGWRRGRPARMVICRCEAGEAIIWRGKSDEKAPTNLSKARVNTPDASRFSDERFYWIPLGHDLSPEEWAKAVEWWNDRTLPQHYNEFDSFNDRKSIAAGEPVSVEFKTP